jgi:broad specificity phosphatase PhoE
MSEPHQEIWLFRHGETEWSLSGAHTSRTDLPLTANGLKQAQELAPRLKGRKFALVLTSPMSRARETCRLAGFGDQAEVTNDLKEWDYGAYEGRSTPDIRKENPTWQLWRDGVADGEPVEHVGERVARVIERCSKVDGDVALFAHGHVLRILTAVWVGLPPGEGKLFALNTGTMSVLGYEHEYRVIRRWNSNGVS